MNKGRKRSYGQNAGRAHPSNLATAVTTTPCKATARASSSAENWITANRHKPIGNEDTMAPHQDL